MELVERAADGIASAMEAVLPFSLGWLDDVFQLTVYFDASLAGAPSDAAGAGAGDNGEAAEPPAAVFCAGAPVRGFVRITAPPGRRVGHAGVSAVLGAALVTAEAAPAGGGAAAAAAGAGLSRTLFELSQTLAPAGEIEGSVDVPFSFAGAATAALPESYEGALFCLRARLAVTVARPWWTFEVAREAPLLVQRLYELPARASYALELSSAGELSSALVASADAAAGTAADAGGGGAPPPAIGAQLAMYGPQTGVLEAADGSSVELAIESGCYELCDKLAGQLHFTGVTSPIVLVRLALLKIEYLNGSTEDEVIFDETLLDARRWRARRLEAARAAGTPVGNEEDDGGASGDIEPSDEEEDEEDDGDEGEEESGGTPPRSPLSSDDDDGDDFGAGEGAADGSAVGASGGSRQRARRASRMAAAAAAKDAARSSASWMPPPEDLEALAAGEPVDADMPIVGDVSMSIALDFSQIAGVQPTLSLLLPPARGAGGGSDDDDGGGEPPLPEGVLRPPSDAVPLLTATQPALREDVSVRFFLRLTIFSSFAPSSKRWLCREVVLFRESLYGHALPPPPPLPRSLQRSVSDASGSAGGAAEASGSGATSPKLTPLTPSRNRAPSVAKLVLGQAAASGGGSGRASANSSFSLGSSTAAAVGSAAAAVVALASSSPRKVAQTPPKRRTASGDGGSADADDDYSLDADAVLDDIEGGHGTPGRDAPREAL